MIIVCISNERYYDPTSEYHKQEISNQKNKLYKTDCVGDYRKLGITGIMGPLFRRSLALLVVYQLLTLCTAFRSYGNRGYISSKETKGFYSDPAPKALAGTSSGGHSQNATKRGLGISAWGLVAVIVTLILAGVGFYYFAICYPILCKKTRKYDMIGLPSVV